MDFSFSTMALYQTRQREELLEVLKASRGHALSATELFHALQAKSSPISRATVYRLLGQLGTLGLVRCWRESQRGTALYELAAEADVADVRCRACERVYHVQCRELGEMAQNVREHLSAEHGFTLDPFAPLFSGLCPDCRKKSSKE